MFVCPLIYSNYENHINVCKSGITEASKSDIQITQSRWFIHYDNFDNKHVYILCFEFWMPFQTNYGHLEYVNSCCLDDILLNHERAAYTSIYNHIYMYVKIMYNFGIHSCLPGCDVLQYNCSLVLGCSAFLSAKVCMNDGWCKNVCSHTFGRNASPAAHSQNEAKFLNASSNAMRTQSSRFVCSRALGQMDLAVWRIITWHVNSVLCVCCVGAAWFVSCVRAFSGRVKLNFPRALFSCFAMAERFGWWHYTVYMANVYKTSWLAHMCGLRAMR